MVGVVYIGNNPQSEERLKYLPGKHVIFKKDYSEAASECNTRKLYDHYIIFLEKTSPGYDTAAITYLKQNCQTAKAFTSSCSHLVCQVKSESNTNSVALMTRLTSTLL